jgi:hypothetical protein
LAQTNTTTEDPKLAADDEEGCMRNLKTIYEAIQAYRVDHKDIPHWLSDLVPQYITDPSLFICPACKRTGQTVSGLLADPKMPCSYLYEFCMAPLTKQEAPGGAGKTRRDLKRQQMAIVGSVVPMVRCSHHAKVLNVAFDGRIYQSPAMWQDLLTNKVNVAELRAPSIFPAASTAKEDGMAAPSKLSYPPRDPQAKPGLIDLSAYYNASLKESWHDKSKNDLASLPTGAQNFAGVDYDVRGIIQLGSTSPLAQRFPTRINEIKIRQKCARLHFLHAAAFGDLANEGERVGSYILHFAINQMQLEIPIIYGRDVRNWHTKTGEKPAVGLAVAWTGTNAVSASAHQSLRLFTTTWVNVAPDVEIESIDFVSGMGTVAPFLIAVTAD